MYSVSPDEYDIGNKLQIIQSLPMVQNTPLTGAT